ncbi:helix-turn-helix domain-containing protein [Siccirubricoccus sp. KC 17139]|uniref:Helix-turn-helix domain-containing protein n=1 Tax=Siccirubricoccus soli TaxID=2899147 RepID=A0ABT1D2F6_9PROT|nr:helix-turn-helix domain-containing protein [Siccirubricoccus soli]MCO6416122.1 helix-turn-helix domain-containing protein [Siccirubricoccus soli]MCP2682256.1 helix-turn-helix domain-containing protein [Siccirubricoccus soli]
MDTPATRRAAILQGALIPIGQLAREAGCKVQTVRWYEEVGLLPPAARTEGGHRLYGRPHRERLAFIRQAREFGFGLEAIRRLLDLATHPKCPHGDAHALAVSHLAEVEAKLRRLAILRDELARLVDAGCDGASSECRVLETLADHDHGHCLSAAQAAAEGAVTK